MAICGRASGPWSLLMHWGRPIARTGNGSATFSGDARSSIASRGIEAAPDSRERRQYSMGAASSYGTLHMQQRTNLTARLSLESRLSPDLEWLRGCVDFLVKRDK